MMRGIRNVMGLVCGNRGGLAPVWVGLALRKPPRVPLFHAQLRVPDGMLQNARLPTA